MSYNLTIDQRLLASGQNENIVVLADTSGTTPREVSFVIDYSDYYKRISVAFETIAANSTLLVQKLTSIDDHLDTQGTLGNLASKITSIDDHLDTQGTLGNLASKITTMSEEITSIDDHLDTQGTPGNLASKVTTMSEEITSIDDHLDTQGTPGNLASKVTTISEEITSIDDHLDTNYQNNLAGKIANIESHLNSFDLTYQFTISNATGKFLENEIVRDENLNSARVIKHFDKNLIVDSLSSLFTGTTLTGTGSNTTANIINKLFVKNLGKEITEFNRQEDVYRLILKHNGTTQTRSIIYNRLNENSSLSISSPGNITIDEKDTLILNSVNSGFANNAENLFITKTENPTDLSNDAIENENISGQGTRTITWHTTYIDEGTYYWSTASRSRSGTITVNFKGYRIDEKITGSNGGIGYVRSYVPISDIDLRIIDIQSVFDDFTANETISGSLNNNNSTIDDIIRLNSTAGNSSLSSNLRTSPAESFGAAALYKLYVEDGEILSSDKTVSPADQARALRKLNDLIKKASG